MKLVNGNVLLMKVMVEMITMEREKSARNWASFEVQGKGSVLVIKASTP